MEITMKVCFSVDDKTKVEFYGEEIEPEMAIRTSEGLLIEIFGTKEDLIKFANEIHKTVNQ